jgi:hypothetical protein
MADPRKDADYEGIGYKGETFKYDNTIVFDKTKMGNSAQVGLTVTTTGNKQVGLIEDAQRVAGKLILVEGDGFCTVQTEGGCELPAGDAATVTAGSKIVGALGAAGAKGYIRNAAATAAEDAVAEHEIRDAADTTKVKVMLGA